MLLSTLIVTGYIFLNTTYYFMCFDKSTIQPQFINSIYLNQIYYPLINLDLILPINNFQFQELGIDGLSIFFLLLTSFLIFLCFLDIWMYETIFNKLKEFVIYFLLLELFLIVAFTTLDLFIFYIFFESVLIPMFLIIGIWGSRERKIRANFYFFIYTLAGSILLFFCITILFFEVYNTQFFVLYSIFMPFEKECFLWVLSFIAFSVKIPMFPFHIWLPEAHVEAEHKIEYMKKYFKIDIYSYILTKH